MNGADFLSKRKEGVSEKLISENGIFADMVKKQTESGSWSIA